MSAWVLAAAASVGIVIGTGLDMHPHIGFPFPTEAGLSSCACGVRIVDSTYAIWKFWNCTAERFTDNAARRAFGTIERGTDVECASPAENLIAGLQKCKIEPRVWVKFVDFNQPVNADVRGLGDTFIGNTDNCRNRGFGIIRRAFRLFQRDNGDLGTVRSVKFVAGKLQGLLYLAQLPGSCSPEGYCKNRNNYRRYGGEVRAIGVNQRPYSDKEAFNGGLTAILALLGFGLFALWAKCDINHRIGDVTDKNSNESGSDERSPIEFM